MLFTVEWLIQGYKCQRKYPPIQEKYLPQAPYGHRYWWDFDDEVKNSQINFKIQSWERISDEEKSTMTNDLKWTRRRIRMGRGQGVEIFEIESYIYLLLLRWLGCLLVSDSITRTRQIQYKEFERSGGKKSTYRYVAISYRRILLDWYFSKYLNTRIFLFFSLFFREVLPSHSWSFKHFYADNAWQHSHTHSFFV